MNKNIRTLLAGALAWLAFQSMQLTFAAALPVYVFSSFTGDTADDMKLRIYASADATNFTLYADTGYGGPPGCSLRDPSIMKHTDGRYYVVFTSPPYNQPYANQNFVGLAWSTNLQTWNTMPSIYTTNIPGVKLSWAPEWVVDGSGIPKFIVHCSSASSDLRPYLYTATNSDLTGWSGPVDIGIGSLYLDGQILKVGNTWHCFIKSNLLQHATAPSITGPWTWLPNRADWANMEGPCAVQLSNGLWVMYVDPMYDVTQYMTSLDLTNWSAPFYLPSGGPPRHGTAIRDDAFNLPPVGLNATPGNSSVALQWNPFGGASSYNLKRSLTNGGPYSLIANLTGTNFTDSNVLNNVTYYYVVSTIYAGNESPGSTAVSARPVAKNNSSWGDLGDGTYKNPIIPGDYSDQDVIRVGDTYYMISSTMQMSPGMAVLQSKDLVNWQSISHVVTDLNQIGSELNYTAMNAYGRGVWAGSIRYYNGKFWCYISTPDHGYFMSTATNAAGPWASLTHVGYDTNSALPGSGWDDCCSFQDDDGSLYFVGTCYSAGYATHLWRLSPDGTQLVSATDTVIYTGSSAEANKIYKFNGYYYIYHSKVTSGRNAFMLRATNIWGNGGSPGSVGTYEEHQLYQTGGNDREPNQGGLVQAPDGSWWFPTHQGTMGVEGRPACLLPVTWTNNWPVIGVDASGTGIGSMVWSGIKPTNGFPIVLPQGSDEFDSTNLNPQWQWNYQPRSDYWSLSARPGFLRLSAFQPLTTGSFFKAGNTLCQRYMKSEWARADVRIDVANMAGGEEGGLATFDGGGTYRTLGVAQTGTTRTLKFNNNGTTTMGPVVTNTTIYLRTQMDSSSNARLLYSYDGINFTQLGRSFALTSANYRGSEIGIYNYNNTSASGYIDVDWFHYAYSGPVLPPFATSPNPADGTGGFGKQLTLGWQAGAGATAHQIYFGTNPAPGSLEYQGQQTATNFMPASLALGTTYYWRVDEVNSNGVSPGNIWSFTTGNTSAVTGVVAYWPFDASGGTTAMDASGNTNTATLAGGASWTSGVVSNAVSLDGSTGLVNCPTNLLNGLTNFTIAAWVKPAAISTWARIFDFGSNTKSYMFLAPQSGNGTLRFAITTNSYGSEQQISASAPLPANVWTHVAVTLSGGVGTLYTNGVVAGVNSGMTLSPVSLGNTATNQIGKSKFGDPYYNGQIDEFRIYNRALTASEISTLVYPPATPIGLTAIAGDGQVTLTWGGAAYAWGYNVKASTTDGGPYALLAANLMGIAFISSGLTNGKLYYFVVSATNALGESANSEQASIRPVSTMSPQMDLSNGGSQLQLRWPADHTGWRLLVQTNHLANGVSFNTNDWGVVTNSSQTNQFVLPIDHRLPAGFYRLTYP